jgi:hypothetical protein
MGLLNEAGSAFLKFSEKVVEKTEEFTRIARLHLEIRRLEDDAAGIERELGQIVLSRRDSGASSMDLSDEGITGLAGRVADIKTRIARRREEIEALRFAHRGNNNDEI